MRLGAVVLALLTVAAVVFAVLNFQQRSSFVLPDDGVTWMDTTSGVTAWHIVKDSPAAKAGIKVFGTGGLGGRAYLSIRKPTASERGSLRRDSLRCRQERCTGAAN